MFKPKCPCVQDCPDRTIHCKSYCDKFAKWDAEYKEYRAELEHKKKLRNEYCEYRSKVMEQPMKRKYRRKMMGVHGGK